MEKFDLSCEVALEFTDEGDISVNLWLGDTYSDAIEFVFNVQEVLEEALNGSKNARGQIHTEDQAHLKLVASALEKSVSVATDSLRSELRKL